MRKIIYIFALLIFDCRFVNFCDAENSKSVDAKRIISQQEITKIIEDIKNENCNSPRFSTGCTGDCTNEKMHYLGMRDKCGCLARKKYLSDEKSARNYNEAMESSRAFIQDCMKNY